MGWSGNVGLDAAESLKLVTAPGIVGVVLADVLRLVIGPGMLGVVLADLLKLLGMPGSANSGSATENEMLKSLVFTLLRASWHLT